MRKIAIMIGSDSDLPQTLEGLQWLQQQPLVEVISVMTNSIHRNTENVLRNLNYLVDDGVSVIVVGAGMANHLTGTCDAYLRYGLANTQVHVIGVAFTGKQPEHTQAAVDSIKYVPGTQVVMDADGEPFVGSEGFLAACQRAATLDLREIVPAKPKVVEARSLETAIEFTQEKIDRDNRLLAEGKTKTIWKLVDDEDHDVEDVGARIEYKNTITAFDDPSYTREFTTKASCSNQTTCNVFELLRRRGVATAYRSMASETSFYADMCNMIPLEVVARRYAVGSYLKRHPELKKDGAIPHRFSKVLIEFFLKTTNGVFSFENKTILSNLSVDDPFIVDPHSEDLWSLHHPKREFVIGYLTQVTPVTALTKVMENTTREVFLNLERAWNDLGLKLVDFKIEFGIDSYGNLVVADVIDNDSWRLYDLNWNDISKESFRQGNSLEQVEQNYELVARLTDKF